MVKSDIGTTTYELSEETSVSINYIGPKWAVPSFLAVTDQDHTQDVVEGALGYFNKWSTSGSNIAFASDQQFNGYNYTVHSWFCSSLHSFCSVVEFKKKLISLLILSL